MEVLAALVERAFGNVAYHCGGAATETVEGGLLAAQPPKTRAMQSKGKVKKNPRLTSQSGVLIKDSFELEIELSVILWVFRLLLTQSPAINMVLDQNASEKQPPTKP